jgi:electron transport complex protein RnfB
VHPVAPEEIALAAAVAVIDEARCIGCTLCIAACPVDAIVGAARLMHSVVTSICTGCELCLAPCPVDCISMRTYPRPEADRRGATAEARRRCEARNARLERAEEETAAQRLARAATAAERRKRATIARALERARLRLDNSRQP